MRWQIAQFVFCEQHQSLTGESKRKAEVTQLEPMMVELLSYFCQHPNEIVSKDTLIEKVWLGRIVTDNAVSKLITKLRKVLGDDVKQPRFIATFPKKGYKFIAQATPISEYTSETPLSRKNEQRIPTVNTQHAALAAELPSASEQAQGNSQFKMVSLAVALVAFVTIGLIFSFSNNIANSPANFAKSVTTDAGSELFPAVSPDGSHITYMLSKGKTVKLIVKRLADQKKIEVKHGDGIGVGPASWNDSGTKLAYLVATPNQCQYFIREVNGLTLGEPELIHNCPAGSFGKILFTHDDNRLVFAEIPGKNQGYSLFEINLVIKKVRRLNQPEVILGGNSQFDLHPMENKLLISSPDKQQWEGFYSLDLESDELTLLFKQDAYICCGIWSHDGQRVVLMGEHPAYQLLSYDMKGKDRQVIYSGSRQITWPHRHSNGVDYLFSSSNHNEDIHAVSLINDDKYVLADATADEHLVAYSSARNQIAFISFASGSEEIWVAEVGQSNGERTPANKLTNFSDSRHYVDLLWSPDGKHLLALMLNEIHLIDASTGEFTRLKLPQSEIRGVSFKSASQVSYSVKRDNSWRVQYYDLHTHKAHSEQLQWQFIRYQSNPEDTLWLDQSNNLYVGEVPTLVDSKRLRASNLLNGRQFNLTKRGDDYFWYERIGAGNIKHYSTKTNEVNTITQSDSVHFAIAENALLFGSTQRGSIDIYQTQSVSR